MLKSNGHSKRCEECFLTFDRYHNFCPSCGVKLIATEFICNCCGLTCALIEGDEGENGGLLKHTVSGGYYSTPGDWCGALDDTTSYTFSLCEFCIDWLFTKCVIPPTVTSDSAPIEWKSAETRVKEDTWRSQKQRFLDRKMLHDLAREKR